MLSSGSLYLVPLPGNLCKIGQTNSPNAKAYAEARCATRSGEVVVWVITGRLQATEQALFVALKADRIKGHAEGIEVFKLTEGTIATIEKMLKGKLAQDERAREAGFDSSSPEAFATKWAVGSIFLPCGGCGGFAAGLVAANVQELVINDISMDNLLQAIGRISPLVEAVTSVRKDFLQMQALRKFSSVLINPPWTNAAAQSIWQHHVLHAAAFVEEGGVLAVISASGRAYTTIRKLEQMGFSMVQDVQPVEFPRSLVGVSWVMRKALGKAIESPAVPMLQDFSGVLVSSLVPGQVRNLETDCRQFIRSTDKSLLSGKSPGFRLSGPGAKEAVAWIKANLRAIQEHHDKYFLGGAVGYFQLPYLEQAFNMKGTKG